MQYIPVAPAIPAASYHELPELFSYAVLVSWGQEHPNFQGVWRLHDSTSVSESLPSISTNGAGLTMKTFSRGANRYTLTEAEFVIGKERSGTLQRMPARFRASCDGSALVLEWSAIWPWGEQSEHHKMVMSEDGKSLLDDFTDTFKTRVRQHSATYDRAPSEAEKLFDYPEQNSGEHFKNVQVLKNLPASALTRLMGKIQTALGVDCTYCHNQPAYDSVEKPEKKMARKMISMTLDLNRREFQGRDTVTCFTCHRGKSTPDSH